jgi:adenine-specific DNA-methyltransferase
MQPQGGPADLRTRPTQACMHPGGPWIAFHPATSHTRSARAWKGAARASRLSNLLVQVEHRDRGLAADLRREVKALSERREFGLNFERHTPGTVELPGRPVRKGDKVRFLPPRGDHCSDTDHRLWKVVAISRTAAGRIAALARQAGQDSDVETVTRSCDDLVVVAEFRDPIYPGLASTGKVERGGDKPFHAVINAANFHALQTLLYTHEGKVDAISIDPPYNTRDKDWKYNNDYVDSDDDYKHSKWLAGEARSLPDLVRGRAGKTARRHDRWAGR